MTPILRNAVDQVDNGNPYRPGSIAAHVPGEGPEEEEKQRARGLDGDAIDSLMISRHIEGERLGRKLAWAEFAPRQAGIWDEGFNAGHDQGHRQGHQAAATAVVGALKAALPFSNQAKAQTGSQSVKDSITEVERQIVHAIISLDPNWAPPTDVG